MSSDGERQRAQDERSSRQRLAINIGLAMIAAGVLVLVAFALSV